MNLVNLMEYEISYTDWYRLNACERLAVLKDLRFNIPTSYRGYPIPEVRRRWLARHIQKRIRYYEARV